MSAAARVQVGGASWHASAGCCYLRSGRGNCGRCKASPQCGCADGSWGDRCDSRCAHRSDTWLAAHPTPAHCTSGGPPTAKRPNSVTTMYQPSNFLKKSTPTVCNSPVPTKVIFLIFSIKEWFWKKNWKYGTFSFFKNRSSFHQTFKLHCQLHCLSFIRNSCHSLFQFNKIRNILAFLLSQS